MDICIYSLYDTAAYRSIQWKMSLINNHPLSVYYVLHHQCITLTSHLGVLSDPKVIAT